MNITIFIMMAGYFIVILMMGTFMYLMSRRYEKRLKDKDEYTHSVWELYRKAKENNEYILPQVVLDAINAMAYYSQISTVTNVQPVGMMTHEEAWKVAMDWFHSDRFFISSEGKYKILIEE